MSKTVKPTIGPSGKTTETVHSELYREYLITVELIPALTVEEDVFAVNATERYKPLIDGGDIVNAGVCAMVGDAIIAAKKWVDSTLLHPLTGKTLTRTERDAVTIEPTTIDDLG